MAEHINSCKAWRPECQCFTCKNDKRYCCLLSHGQPCGDTNGKPCNGDCPDYEPEETEGGDVA